MTEVISFHLYEINHTPTRYKNYMDNLEDFFLLAGYKVANIDNDEKSAYVVANDQRTISAVQKYRNSSMSDLNNDDSYIRQLIQLEPAFTQNRFIFVDERVQKQIESYINLVETVVKKKPTGKVFKEKAFRIKKQYYDVFELNVNYPPLPALA